MHRLAPLALAMPLLASLAVPLGAQRPTTLRFPSHGLEVVAPAGWTVTVAPVPEVLFDLTNGRGAQFEVQRVQGKVSEAAERLLERLGRKGTGSWTSRDLGDGRTLRMQVFSVPTGDRVVAALDAAERHPALLMVGRDPTASGTLRTIASGLGAIGAKRPTIATPARQPKTAADPKVALGKRVRFARSDAPAMDFALPKGWTMTDAPRGMRLAVVKIANPKVGELPIWGRSIGGSVAQNFTRWKGQMSGASNAREQSFKVPGGGEFSVLFVDGSFSSSMGRGAKGSGNDRMMAAAFMGPGGPLWFKVVGPVNEIAKHEAEFLAMLRSFRPVKR